VAPDEGGTKGLQNEAPKHCNASRNIPGRYTRYSTLGRSTCQLVYTCILCVQYMQLVRIVYYELCPSSRGKDRTAFSSASATGRAGDEQANKCHSPPRLIFVTHPPHPLWFSGRFIRISLLATLAGSPTEFRADRGSLTDPAQAPSGAGVSFFAVPCGPRALSTAAVAGILI
jgi:hypothetical protein